MYKSLLNSYHTTDCPAMKLKYDIYSYTRITVTNGSNGYHKHQIYMYICVCILDNNSYSICFVHCIRLGIKSIMAYLDTFANEKDKFHCLGSCWNNGWCQSKQNVVQWKLLQIYKMSYDISTWRQPDIAFCAFLACLCEELLVFITLGHEKDFET